MEFGYGLLITLAIALWLADGRRLPPWLLRIRMLTVPLFIVAALFLLILGKTL